jgi:N-acetylmuramoyl-L-alanine amidase
LALHEFATGSCVALPPISGNRAQTVFLDPGHGGPDPGAASGSTEAGQYIEERAITLPVALDAAQLLRIQGYRVVLSRTSDTSVAKMTPTDLDNGVLTTPSEHADLLARVACANLSGAAALVSIHFDAYPDPNAAGATALYDTARPFAPANQALHSARAAAATTSRAPCSANRAASHSISA